MVDVFDALTTDRPYRKAMATFDGLQVMIDQMPDHIASDLFATFIRLFEQNPQVLGAEG